MGHLTPLSLTLLDDVHANLHSQVLLVVAELVVDGLDGSYSRGRDVLVQLLVGTQSLLSKSADEVFLSLLNAVDALSVIR